MQDTKNNLWWVVGFIVLIIIISSVTTTWGMNQVTMTIEQFGASGIQPEDVIVTRYHRHDNDDDDWDSDVYWHWQYPYNNQPVPVYIPNLGLYVNPTSTQKLSVDWLSPVGNGQTCIVYGEKVRLAAQATGPASINKIRFYRSNGIDIGYAYSSPYEVTLDSSVLNDQENDIYVQAFDSAGNLSDIKYIVLNRQKPTSTPQPQTQDELPKVQVFQRERTVNRP